MIPLEHAHLHAAAATHPGRRGKNNEDQFSVSAYQLSATDPTPSLFAIIADGIGGHQAGEVAAEIAVEMISQAVAESDASQPTAIMQAAIIQASQAILAQADADAEKQGMGTTCVCVWIIGDRLYITSVGNSRLYLVRGNRMHQINFDHTWVQEAIDAGALTHEQARNHPNANIIRRYVGSRKPVEVDIRLRLHPDDVDSQAENNQGASLQPGDRLLMCSDGLSDMVENEDIFQTINSHDLEEAVPLLINLANEKGGKDNITVVALEMPDSKRKRKPRSEDEKRKLHNGLSCLAGVILAVIGLALVAGLGWYVFLRPVGTPTPTLQKTTTAIPLLSPSASPSTDSPDIDPAPSSTNPPHPTATYTPWPTDTPIPSPTLTATQELIPTDSSSSTP